MKKQAYTLVAMIVLVGSMAVAAQAQTSGRTQMIVNIPFQFNAGDTTLPAGEYTISQVNPASDHAVLQVRAKRGNQTVLVQTSAAIRKSNKGSELIFNRYGNKYFFAQAWIDGESDGLRAVKSRSEGATQKELAALNVRVETVALRSR